MLLNWDLGTETFCTNMNGLTGLNYFRELCVKCKLYWWEPSEYRHRQNNAFYTEYNHSCPGNRQVVNQLRLISFEILFNAKGKTLMKTVIPWLIYGCLDFWTSFNYINDNPKWSNTEQLSELAEKLAICQ